MAFDKSKCKYVVQLHTDGSETLVAPGDFFVIRPADMVSETDYPGRASDSVGKPIRTSGKARVQRRDETANRNCANGLADLAHVASTLDASGEEFGAAATPQRARGRGGGRRAAGRK